ncbi:MAG: ABC transporter ATP-binding protein [Gemmatimonadaceae bacterium]
MSALLRVEDLATHFLLDEGVLRAVDGVSFDIAAGETVALVGESGCGKTIVAHSILKLVQWPGRIMRGRILLDGEDVLATSTERLREIRGGDIGLVFQEPGASLNPVFTVGAQLVEVLRLHRGMSADDARREAVRLLDDVGIPEARERFRSYPFELSGGMRQRVAIALAVSGRPKLLIADEPTTALDVTVQAEILKLLRRIQIEYGMAILIISHDIGVVASVAERVLVMYTGRLVEAAPAAPLFRDPAHPYTRGLLASAPRLGMGRDAPLRGIPGAVPNLLDLPAGCTFHPRCPIGDESCTVEFPPFVELEARHECACYKPTLPRSIPAPGL